MFAGAITVFGDWLFGEQHGTARLLQGHVIGSGIIVATALGIKAIKPAGGTMMSWVAPLTAGALLTDGVCLGMAPHVYGVTGVALSRAAGWITFGAGVGLVCAAVMDGKPHRL